MKNEEFIQRLSEFAELKPNKIPRTGSTRENDPQEIFRNGHTFTVHHKENPSHSFSIKKFKQKTKTCEDCGLKHKNTRVVESKVYAYPKKHWRVSCSECGLVKDPETNKFELKSYKAPAVFVAFFKETNK